MEEWVDDWEVGGYGCDEGFADGPGAGVLRAFDGVLCGACQWYAHAPQMLAGPSTMHTSRVTGSISSYQQFPQRAVTPARSRHGLECLTV